MAVLTFGNSCLSYSGNLLKFTDPYNPLELPPYTIRLQYPDGITPTFRRGDSVQVSVSPNVWDLTTINVAPSSSWQDHVTGPEDWHQLLKDDKDVVAVLGANSTGVTLMHQLFYGCSHLSSVVLFDTASVTNTAGMHCENYLLSNIPNYDLSNNTNMNGMFEMCNSLSQIPMFNTSKVVSMDYTLYQTAVEVMVQWDTSNVTSMEGMFMDTLRLRTVPMLNTSNVTNMSFMFSSQYSLNYTLQSLPCFDTSRVTDMSAMLYDRAGLTALPNFNTDNVTKMSAAFANCRGVNGGALSLYQRISSQANPPTEHVNTFENTGMNTAAGLAELQQIPASWGGRGA